MDAQHRSAPGNTKFGTSEHFLQAMAQYITFGIEALHSFICVDFFQPGISRTQHQSVILKGSRVGKQPPERAIHIHNIPASAKSSKGHSSAKVLSQCAEVRSDSESTFKSSDCQARRHYLIHDH